jgi:regulatory protein
MRYMKKFTTYNEAMQYSLRLLRMRSYSEYSLRQKLNQHDVEVATQDAILDKLKHLNLINDQHYSQSMIRTQATYRHASSRQISQKLMQKGIDRNLITTTLEQSQDSVPSEEERALYHAEQFLKRVKLTHDSLQAPEVRQKLGAALARRGFSYSVIKAITKKLHQ